MEHFISGTLKGRNDTCVASSKEIISKYYFKNECEGFIRFPNTRKHLKPGGRRPSGFIVFECLET